MAITKRLVKGSPLSFQEGDDNLDYLLTNMSGSYISIQGGITNVTGSLNAPNITGSLLGTSSWAISASYAPNIYNIDGTLTANRTVTLDDKQLIFRSSGSALTNYTYTIGVPTGAGTRTWPSSLIYEAQFTMPTSTVEPINTRVWARNQTSGFRSFWVNQVFADITGESTGGTSLFNQYFVSYRGSQLDTSTSTNGGINGVTSVAGHGYLSTQNSTTTAITSSGVIPISSQLLNYTGHITSGYNYIARTNVANSYVANNTRTSSLDNIYNIYVENNIGGNYAPATVGNIYSLYITNIVGPSGTVANRWGIYAIDGLSKHYINGNLSLGTVETGSFKLLVSGSTKFSGSVEVTGSLRVSQSITASDALFTGNITAQTLVVQIITSSITYSSGSNIFGNELTNKQTFTGSVTITGSLSVKGLNTSNQSNVLTLDTASGQLYYTASSAVGNISPIAATGSSLYSINPVAGIPTGDSVTGSIFFGELAGAASTGNKHSNFLGYRAGYSSSDADNSTFIGENAGYLSLYSDNSIFMGREAGSRTTSSYSSIFLGPYAGYGADYAFYSNFIGSTAGYQTTANYANFIGSEAGFGAINADNSNFIGNKAGYEAGKAEYSIFIGVETGRYATSASFSNFIGNQTGLYAKSSSYSTLIGYRVGNNVEFFTQIEKPGRGLGSNNIIIGTNISLPDDTKDSINFGGLIFGTGSYATTTGNPFSGSAMGRIGINQPFPSQSLDVSGSVQISRALILPPTHPLPSPMPTGSIMSSGSNADCKPYFWNGNIWTSMI